MEYAVTETKTQLGELPVVVCTPEGSGPFPTFVLLHERYGLVRHTLDLAKKLARSGYVVGAPDIFYTHPDQEALHRGDARMGPLSDDWVADQIATTVTHLESSPAAAAGRVGVMGVCATGRYPIVYGARHPLQACVVLHGATSGWEVNEHHQVSMEEMVAALTCPVLGMFGEKDHGISVDHVRNFRNLLEDHDKVYDIAIYEGAPHGWLNDTMPGRYRKEAADLAWNQLLGFLETTLSEEGPGGDPITWRFQSVKSRDYDFSKNERFE